MQVFLKFEINFLCTLFIHYNIVARSRNVYITSNLTALNNLTPRAPLNCLCRQKHYNILRSSRKEPDTFCLILNKFGFYKRSFKQVTNTKFDGSWYTRTDRRTWRT